MWWWQDAPKVPSAADTRKYPMEAETGLLPLLLLCTEVPNTSRVAADFCFMYVRVLTHPAWCLKLIKCDKNTTASPREVLGARMRMELATESLYGGAGEDRGTLGACSQPSSRSLALLRWGLCDLQNNCPFEKRWAAGLLESEHSSQAGGDAATLAAFATAGQSFCLPGVPLDKRLLRASPKPPSSSPSAAQIPAPRLRRQGCSCSSLEVTAPEQRLIWCLCEFICLKREGPALTSQAGDWWGVYCPLSCQANSLQYQAVVLGIC